MPRPDEQMAAQTAGHDLYRDTRVVWEMNRELNGEELLSSMLSSSSAPYSSTRCVFSMGQPGSYSLRRTFGTFSATRALTIISPSKVSPSTPIPP